MRFQLSPQHMKSFLIVVDYNYYVTNEQEITEWADRCIPGWKLTGMILEFKNDHDRLAFMLRWE